MKKLAIVLLSALVLLTSACGNVSDLLGAKATPTPRPVVTQRPTFAPDEVSEPEDDEGGNEREPEDDVPKTKITLSKNLKMTNEWTIMGDYSCKLTNENKKDRIVLGTSAKTKNGEMVWDDSQYWTLAVISEDGAYNLFSKRMTGYVYTEVNEIYVRGVSTPVVTAYIFSGTDREIRNYIFDGEAFVEEQVYNTKKFSTGGINNKYSNFPEYKPQ